MYAVARIARFLAIVAAVVAFSSTKIAQAQTAAAPAGPNTWNIDANHTASQFSVKHLMVSTVRGQFEKTTGTVDWDGKDPKTMLVNVTVDPATVKTRVKMRDNDLRSANFFNVAKYPTITFVSKKVDVAAAGMLKMTGDLTMRGVTKEIVLDVEGPSAPIKQGQNLRIFARASVKINRLDWKLRWGRMAEAAAVVGDEIMIMVDIEATKRAG